MATIKVPIKVDGIEVIRQVLNDICPKWDLDTPKEYQQGFLDCLTIMRKTVDALEGDEG